MAYQLMGNAAISRGNYQGPGYTFLDVLTPSPGRGILKLWDVYMNNNVADAKVKIFRDDGTNYLFIGECPAQAVVAYANLGLHAWIPVEKGDLIGIYVVEEVECGSTANKVAYKAGDITANSLKSGWSLSVGPLSLQGKIFTRVTPFLS